MNEENKLPLPDLGRGFLSGAFQKRDDLIPADRRHAHPRFQEGNFEKNLNLLEPIKAVAHAKGCTMAQVAIAWVLSRGDDIVPLIGARRRDRLTEAIRALEVSLDDDALAQIERAVPRDAAAGDRYPEPQMAMLDSER